MIVSIHVHFSFKVYISFVNTVRQARGSENTVDFVIDC